MSAPKPTTWTTDLPTAAGWYVAALEPSSVCAGHYQRYFDGARWSLPVLAGEVDQHLRARVAAQKARPRDGAVYRAA